MSGIVFTGGSSGGGGAPANVLKELGEVEGEVTPKLGEGNVFAATTKGATTFQKPTGWSLAYQEALVIITQDAVGHAVTFGAGIIQVGAAVNTEPHSTSVFSFVSHDNGTTVYAVNAVQGYEGSRGEKGTTGAEGPKGTTGTTGAEGPPGAIGTTEALGALAAGTHKVNVEKKQAFTGEVTGNITIELEKWPAGDCEPVFILTQDSIGGHTITFTGVAWEPEEPEVITAPNAVNIFQIMSPDKGVHIYGLTTKGPKGLKGTTGETGPEGKAGAWQALESVEPNCVLLEATTSKPEARTELGGAKAVLRGVIESKTGGGNLTKLFTVPVSCHPTKAKYIQVGQATALGSNPEGGGVRLLKINTSGVVEVLPSMPEKHFLYLDNIGWDLT